MKKKIVYITSIVLGTLIIVVFAVPFFLSNAYDAQHCSYSLMELERREPAYWYCTYKKNTCEKNGLTWYDGTEGMIDSPAYCAKKYPDANKTCKNSSECMGDCYVSHHTAMGTTTPQIITGRCQENDAQKSQPGCLDIIEQFDPTKDNTCNLDFI